MVQPLRNNFGAIPRLIDGKYWSNYNTPEQNAEAKYPALHPLNQATTMQCPIFGCSMAPISA